MSTSDYATKDEVRSIVREEVQEIVDRSLQNAITVLTGYVDEKTTELRIELKKDIALVKEDLAGVKEDVAGVKEDIIQFKDDILHEIVDLRDDVTVTTGYRDMIEDHENRIIKLESTKSP